MAQFVAAPVLGDLSDRWGRRPVLVFSLLGTVLSFTLLALAHSLTMLFIARIVDGLSGGNITTARAYIADVTPPEDRAKRYGLIGAAFGLGFIFGPALGALFVAHQLHRADLGRGRGLGHRRATCVPWLPEPARHARTAGARPGGDAPATRCRPGRGSAAPGRRLSSTGSTFSVYQTTFALYGQRRFGWDATHIGYVLATFGTLGVMVQARSSGRVTRALGDRPHARRRDSGGDDWVGRRGSGRTASPIFVPGLVPTALGMGLCNRRR